MMTASVGQTYKNISIQQKRRDGDDIGKDSDSDSSFTFKRLLPSSLRQCLSGHEQHKSGLMITVPPPSSSTVPLVRMPDGSDSASCGPVDGKIRKRRSKTAPAMDGDSYHDTRSGGTDCATCSEDYPNFVESLATDSSVTSDVVESEYDFETSDKAYSFLVFRLSYLFVTLVVMLADGLQGTHLYVLYEGYGFSVASLYCLGFITGALTAPISGPLIDRFGRKKSALLYCALEVGINLLEQFPFLSGLIVSRVVGGITTNLLSTVFEAWLDTEYRSRGFAEAEYETLMRDSVVVSNLAAIASGYLAHILAEAFGPVGPFEGAVTCTGVAFAVIALLWSENYGKLGGEDQAAKSSLEELKDTLTFIKADSRVLRVCITQGLTLGSLHIFIFLWSPLLKEFAAGTKGNVWGLDGNGNPAYGLIFGAFMAAGVVGGLCSPMCRKLVTLLLSPLTEASVPETVTVDGEGDIRPMDVEFQGAICYFACAMLLLAPSLMSASSEYTFSIALFSFIAYEFSVGIYSPCEGVMRSIYIPPESRGSVMTVPSMIVNVAVAIAVVSTESIPRQAALGMISVLMMTCAVLQLSLVSAKEWASLFGRIEKAKRASLRPLQSFSSSATEFAGSARRTSLELRRTLSAPFRTRKEVDVREKED